MISKTHTRPLSLPPLVCASTFVLYVFYVNFVRNEKETICLCLFLLLCPSLSRSSTVVLNKREYFFDSFIFKPDHNRIAKCQLFSPNLAILYPPQLSVLSAQSSAQIGYRHIVLVHLWTRFFSRKRFSGRKIIFVLSNQTWSLKHFYTLFIEMLPCFVALAS